MATLKELMGDKVRGEGRRFCSASMLTANEKFFEPIFKDNYGVWYGLEDRANKDYFHETDVDDWEPYTEPKTQKKVKLYMPVVSDWNDQYTTIRYAPELGKEATHAVRFTSWHSDKNFFKNLEAKYDLKIVGWLEQEIEVSEC